MISTVALYKYLAVAGMIVATGCGLPVPEEIPIVMAGIMVGHDANGTNPSEFVAAGGGPMALYPEPANNLRWWIMLPVCIVAVVIGDTALYLIGRISGRRLLGMGWVQRKILPVDKREKIEQNFQKKGVMILLMARLTPGIRTPVFIMAGVLKLPFRQFLIADGLYAIPGINILFWLAYFFTDQFMAAVSTAERFKPLVIVAVLAAVSGGLAYRLITSRRGITGSPDEVPLEMKPVGVVTQAVEQVVEYAIDKVTHRSGDAHHQPAAAAPVVENPEPVAISPAPVKQA